jgi:hypothetical protein
MVERLCSMAGELVGEGDRQHFVMQPFPGRLDQGFSPWRSQTVGLISTFSLSLPDSKD